MNSSVAPILPPYKRNANINSRYKYFTQLLQDNLLDTSQLIYAVLSHEYEHTLKQTEQTTENHNTNGNTEEDRKKLKESNISYHSVLERENCALLALKEHRSAIPYQCLKYTLQHNYNAHSLENSFSIQFIDYLYNYLRFLYNSTQNSAIAMELERSWHYAVNNKFPCIEFIRLLKFKKQMNGGEPVYVEESGELQGTALHVLLRQSIISPELVQILLEVYPQLAAVSSSINSNNSNASNSCHNSSIHTLYPLHHLVKQDSPVSVFQFILNSYPAAAQLTTQYTELPLHEACYSLKLDSNCFKLLIQANPSALTKKSSEIINKRLNSSSLIDWYDLFPIQIACIQACKLQETQLNILIQPNRKLARTSKTREENNILHLLCLFGGNLNCVELVVESFKELMFQRNLQQQLPVEIALLHRPIHIPIVEYLLQFNNLREIDELIYKIKQNTNGNSDTQTAMQLLTQRRIQLMSNEGEVEKDTSRTISVKRNATIGFFLSNLMRMTPLLVIAHGIVRASMYKRYFAPYNGRNLL